MILKYLAHPKFLVLVIVAGVLIVFGTGVFMVLEGWNLLDALYFTVATIMTVGYGNITPAHDFSKILAIVYMLLLIPALLIGVGIVADSVFANSQKKTRKCR